MATQPHVLSASVLAILTVATVVIPVGAAAQGVQTGVLTGVVRDLTDLVLPGVTVNATSPALQGERTAFTDGNGVYLLRGLPPGAYTVTFSLQGFRDVTREATVLLGGTTDVHVTMELAAVTVRVDVVAQAPPPLTTAQLGANFRSGEIDIMPTGRTLAQIAELSPGLTANAPRGDDRQQVTVSGSFGFDNVFLVDGVDINDNVWGGPENLFIEDAIEETQVLTSGVSAEYGRFSGGVVNAITKSGGDSFSGSFRANLSNPAWAAETPFETTAGIEREGDLSTFFEETFGGPIARERLWFFVAGRNERSSAADAFNETGVPFTSTRKNDRFQVKLTGTVAPNHTLQGTYLNNGTDAFQPSTSFTVDPAGLVTRTEPNELVVATYRGLLGSRLFAEVQASRKAKKTTEDRTASTDIRDSSFFTSTLAQYNAPHFDFVNDPEERNNKQVTGSLSYFATTPRLGSHAIKGGVEHFVSTRTGGNSQSQTGFTFDAEFKTDAAGRPVYDAAGRLIPLFQPDDFSTLLETILADRGARLDVRTTSFFLQDEWTVDDRVSLSLGLRFETVRTEATGTEAGVDVSTVVPRLAAVIDATGDGRAVLKSTYAHYAGSYNVVQLAQNSTVGNPTILFGVYTGPAGEGRSFGPGFDPANYQTLICQPCPPANVIFADDLSSPITREFTLGGGTTLGPGGYAELTYIYRTTDNFIDDFITLETGATTLIRDGVELGTFPNQLFRNTDEPERSYQALQVQARQQITPAWTLDGHWTIQLENNGDYEGESRANPGSSIEASGSPSVFGNFPPVFNAARHYPTGRLDGFQRHKLRLWSIYTANLGRAGTLQVTPLVRYESGRVFSYRAFGQRLTSIQRALGAGYASLPRQTVYFGERGAGTFEGYGLVDLAVQYNVPIWKSLRPWIKAEIFNLLDNDGLIAFDTTVVPDPASPVDELGLRTGYLPGPRFGEATSTVHFPPPQPGRTGGRTFQMAFGVRF